MSHAAMKHVLGTPGDRHSKDMLIILHGNRLGHSFLFRIYIKQNFLSGRKKHVHVSV